LVDYPFFYPEVVGADKYFLKMDKKLSFIAFFYFAFYMQQRYNSGVVKKEQYLITKKKE
jgi:hypothetical protein